MKRIAITGAAGVVGSALRGELLGRGYALRLLDLQAINDCADHEDSAIADICDPAHMAASLKGCDAVIHLAACTTDAPWPDQVRLSIEGTISVLDACRAAGVKRVVYASSHHVVGLHPRSPNGPPLNDHAVLRPDSRYGVGKAFGEAMGAMYACKYDMQVLAIRIGNVNIRPIDRRRLGNWISCRDLGQLVSIGIEHPDFVFEIVYGISDATGHHYDNASAYALGYAPQDAIAPFEAQVLAEDPPPAVGSEASRQPGEYTLGGHFSGSEFMGDPARLAVEMDYWVQSLRK